MELWVLGATGVLAAGTYGLYWLVDRLMRSPS
jgi:hypothetical protein